MTELCDIAFKYKTDKCPQIKHHFTEFYHEVFKDKRESVKKVVEIGIGNMTPGVIGASLFMWREYFPNAEIYGADIDNRLRFIAPRIKTFLCDQTVEEDLNDLVYFCMQDGIDIDLFIDDGLHTPESQIFTCKTLMPLLSKNTMYVIEDAAFVNTDLLTYLYDVEVFTPGKNRKYKDDRLVIVRHRG
jgi:hypothetical protein